MKKIVSVLTVVMVMVMVVGFVCSCTALDNISVEQDLNDALDAVRNSDWVGAQASLNDAYETIEAGPAADHIQAAIGTVAAGDVNGSISHIQAAIDAL